MAVSGIIAEFDPFHGGHAHLIATARELFPENGVAVVMSGSFTQRGAPACGDKIARAKAAIENGADVVFELPLAYALSPAPIFALGGVSCLFATGVLTHLVFGSESADLSALKTAASAESSEGFSERLKTQKAKGETFAAAYAKASAEAGAVLSSPNDLLAVEYIRAIEKLCPDLVPVPVKRVGAAHGSSDGSALYPSASHIRELARSGVAPEALPLPENVCKIFAAEAEAGRFPLDQSKLDGAVLAVICRMTEDELAATPEGGDGLGGRIAAAAKTAVSVDGLCAVAKSKNFTMARVRRCVWQSFLGITREDQRTPPQYLRVLALGKRGREILREMEEKASLPVITKPASLNKLSPEALRAAHLEARAENLRSLALSQREDMFRKSPYVEL